MSETKSPARYISKLANELRRKTELFSFSRQYSGAQWKTLHFILTNKTDIFQKDIEKEFNIRSSTATELLRQMEHNGLIRKEPVPYDSRLRKIVATDLAWEHQQEIISHLNDLDAMLIRQIPQEKLDIYFEVAQKMMDNLAE